MPRTRDTITENLQLLKELESDHQGTPFEPRARMLRLLKEHPNLTLGQIGGMIGCSERSLQRWWGQYRSGGVQSLLRQEPSRRGKPRRIDDSALQELQTKLANEGFSQLSEAQEWLQQQFGTTYSRSGVWNLLRNSANAAPRGWRLYYDAPASDEKETGAPSPQSTGVSNQVLHFLNSLPTSSNVRDWILQFREALRGLLGDVDRVAINVNLNYRSDESDETTNAISIRQTMTDRELSTGPIVIDRMSTSRYEGVIDDIKRQGFPVDLYHYPVCFDYFDGGSSYVGSLLLFRELQKIAISDTSRHLIRSMEPFMTFALTDIIARHQSDRPIDRVFYEAIGLLVDEAKLSAQEERVVILQLMGHSYKEMADVLNVTVDTVKKHFKQIHRKTGTRGQAELFAKYFTSRLIPESFRELQQSDR